jgi:hypothetical protein
LHRPLTSDGLPILIGGLLLGCVAGLHDHSHLVPIEGYKCSKNQSGRPDLNRRPLDPQSRSGRRQVWLSVAQWALDQA